METGLYVTLSSQMALEKRLATIADNVANATTIGFRATEVKFDDLMDRSSVAFVSQGEDYLSTRSGGMIQTGNMLDLAIQGEAWFMIDTPAGQVLTRDGRFTMNEDGALVTLQGYAVLDAGAGQIQLDAQNGVPTVTRDGFLLQNGEQVGSIGLFRGDLSAGHSRFENSGVIPVLAPEPVVDEFDSGILQGYIEQSNVNPVAEMTRLIMISRAFEYASAAMRDSETSMEQAISTLGGQR